MLKTNVFTPGSTGINNLGSDRNASIQPPRPSHTTHNHQLTSASRASLGFLGLKGPCFLACSTWERKRIPTNLNINLISYQGFVAEDRLKLVAGDCYHKHTKENLDVQGLERNLSFGSSIDVARIVMITNTNNDY